MSAAWQLDVDDSELWARSTVNTTAGARDWSAGQMAAADDAIDQASPGLFDRLWTSPEDFFADLTAAWSEAGRSLGTVPEGWNELGITWASAGDASYTAAEEEYLGSVVGITTGTAAGIASDAAQAGETGLAFFSPTKGWLDPSGYKFWIPIVGVGAAWMILRK